MMNGETNKVHSTVETGSLNRFYVPAANQALLLLEKSPEHLYL